MFNFMKRNDNTESLLNARIAELESTVSKLNSSLGQARIVNDKQLEVIKELSGSVEVKALTRLKFTCIMPHGSLRESEFTLGLGRCGKTVETLELERTDKLFVITQWHTDGSKKVFTYNVGDIVGRVQECFEVVEVKPNTKYIERVRSQLAWERKQRWLNRR